MRVLKAGITAILTWGCVAHAPAQIYKGEIDGAPFYIEIPDDWDQRVLVMYAHGYTPPPNATQCPINTQNNVLRVCQVHGFAYAASGYRSTGWAVKEGIEDTEALRNYFFSKFGKPSETYIVGHSMGGHIAAATLERYPDLYKGALPMCAPLDAATEFLNEGTFDMLVVFEYLFPKTIGDPYYGKSYQTFKHVEGAIAKYPKKTARFAQRFERRVDELPCALSFSHSVVQELAIRANGHPFDNANRIYRGFDDDDLLNRGVRRFRADPKARDYVRQYYSLTARISSPLLSLHTTSDEFVLPRYVNAYEWLAVRENTSNKFVSRFVVADGHCNFTFDQTDHALNALLDWARNGNRPEGAEQK